MGSICAIIDFKKSDNLDCTIVNKMAKTIRHRGSKKNGMFFSKDTVINQGSLCINDKSDIHLPITADFNNKRYVIAYDGEVYNYKKLREELKEKGAIFKTQTDTEVVLWAYILWGEDFVKRLNGMFSFLIYDEDRKKVFMARDHFGAKPLYYAFLGEGLIVASEIKAILAHGAIKPKVDSLGFWQLMFLSPVTIKGTTIFKDIYQLESATCASFDIYGMHLKKYWELQAKEIQASREEIIYNTKELLKKSIQDATPDDAKMCSLLSGGLDSSCVCAYLSNQKREKGEKLDTFSFEYEGNKENFKANFFQGERDDVYAVKCSEFLSTNHKVLSCSSDTLALFLTKSVDARDFPGQADIDSSLLYYMGEIKKTHDVCFSGECSDEIFGGYPWYYKDEMLNSEFFPWIHSPFIRPSIFNDDFINVSDGYKYLKDIYKKEKLASPVFSDDEASMKKSRVATYITINYFMRSLLERKDRMCMSQGVEPRVPFLEKSLLEYVYNTSWEIKFENEVEKSLLRNAFNDFLPQSIIWRKKCPYPKSHDPKYESIVSELLKKELSKKNLFTQIIDKKKLNDFINGENTTWFGQLMGRAQMLAWLYQLSYWLDKYNIIVV